MDLKKLTDEDLLRRTHSLAAEERRISLDILLYLKEIERRRLHLDRGYSSLYEYALKELKYSEGAAYRRVQAMRLLRDLPETEEKIIDGTLNITNAAKIQTALKNKPVAEKANTVFALLGKSGREVEQQLSSNPPAREGMRWLTSDSVELRLQIGKEPFKHLEELKSLRSNVPKVNSFGHVVEELIELGQERWNPMRRTASSLRRSGAAQTNLAPRYLPPSLRREIWRRDQNQCTYIDPKTKRRCESRHFLHIDHILPVALGGKAEPENLRLLCAQHNQNRARKTYGPSEKNK